MEIKDIIVRLDPTDAGEVRLRLAAAIAREHHAHLSAAYIEPEAIPGAPPHAGSVGPPTGLAWLPRAGGDAGEPPAEIARADLAGIIEERFREAAGSHATVGDWHLLGPGDSARLMTLAKAADLIVLGQVAPDHRQLSGYRPEDVIVGSGRPALVVPYAGAFTAIGRRVLIAWDGTREASRALHDALPLIGRAEAVTIITVRDDAADRDREAPGVARVIVNLQRHGIAARAEATPSGDLPIADLLLSRATDLAADLIVAGAYHHSQLREALIGGVSRALLDHMTVPVLMSH